MLFLLCESHRVSVAISMLLGSCLIGTRCCFFLHAFASFICLALIFLFNILNNRLIIRMIYGLCVYWNKCFGCFEIWRGNCRNFAKRHQTHFATFNLLMMFHYSLPDRYFSRLTYKTKRNDNTILSNWGRCFWIFVHIVFATHAVFAYVFFLIYFFCFSRS